MFKMRPLDIHRLVWLPLAEVFFKCATVRLFSIWYLRLRGRLREPSRLPKNRWAFADLEDMLLHSCVEVSVRCASLLKVHYWSCGPPHPHIVTNLRRQCISKKNCWLANEKTRPRTAASYLWDLWHTVLPANWKTLSAHSQGSFCRHVVSSIRAEQIVCSLCVREYAF